MKASSQPQGHPQMQVNALALITAKSGIPSLLVPNQRMKRESNKINRNISMRRVKHEIHKEDKVEDAVEAAAAEGGVEEVEVTNQISLPPSLKRIINA